MLVSALLSLVAFAAPTDGFVKTNGMKFVLNGKEHYVFSANYWQAMNLGAVDAAQGNRTRLIRDLDAMKRMGINNLRIMASSEGPNTEPYRMTPAMMNKPGEYNEAVLDGLDFAMAEIGKRGMKAVMVMTNAWQWSGGMAQYVNWVTGEPIPYPPSWDPKLGDYSQGDWQTFIQYARRFYEDQQVLYKAQDWYQRHIGFIVNRVNKYTGLAYKDDPTIFSWQLANEPQATPQWWAENTAKYIKSIAPKHMVSVGLEAKEGEADYLRAHDNPYVDYGTNHIWVQNAGIYNMMDPSEQNIANAIQWAINRIDNADQWSRKINKPCVLEEFGMARDNWQAKGKADLYSPAHTTKNKDRYYGSILMRSAELYKKGGSYAGFGFWAYSGEARPGDKWISDPPHEAPGWYAVYDTDVSTIEAMKKVVSFATS
jgi:mannan endo-1,4-beta-mannosidase